MNPFSTLLYTFFGYAGCDTRLVYQCTEYTPANSNKPTTTPALCHRESTIDLTFATPKLYSIHHWDILQDPMGNNHYPIITSSKLTRFTRTSILK
ncbi:hypothetical protein J6590_029829 [Homalodisca vitripennis]|nr:hypothetical protein J6590_029829 [Homalodisca vitripennis]